MSCRPQPGLAFLLFAALALAGCYPTQPLYLRDGGDLSYYLDQATAVEYPDVDSMRLDEVAESHPPITVLDPDFDSFFDLTLEECVGIALQNSKVIRGYGTPGLSGSRVSPGIDTLTTGSAGVGTFYNISIRETEPGFLNAAGNVPSPSSITTNTGLDANQGVESALAEFDAQVSSNLFWTRSDEPRNTVAPFDRTAFRQDQVTFQNQIAKRTAEGTQWFVRNVNVYTANNIPLASDPLNPGFQILPSWWRAAIELEARQPLFRGRGAFINRMPIVVSRIGTDQEIANLESQLQNMVTNVEIRYWDLQAAYRNLEAAKAGRDAALKTWRVIKNQYDEGADVTIQEYAQATEQYHFFDEQVVDAFNTLLSAESALRWLMGLAANDGQIIRPIDEPITAPIEFDWCASLDEALAFRPELRQVRWELKKRELAVAYAKNSLLPEVNVTSLYRFLGLGDRVTSYDEPLPNFPIAGSGAYNELFEGRYQELQFGLEARSNVGFRRELSNVRNAQLKLAREHSRLEDLELDVSRELSDAIKAMAANYRIVQIAFNRWASTTQELEHFDRVIDEGLETIDIILDAQRRSAQAEIAFFTALAEYNKTIALIHRRKGTVLAYNGVDFAEGPWTGKAYQDARENARRRSASKHVNYGWTRPEVISQGPMGTASAGETGCSDCHSNMMPEDMNPVIEHPYYSEEISPESDLHPQQLDGDNSNTGIPLGSNNPTTSQVGELSLSQQTETVLRIAEGKHGDSVPGTAPPKANLPAEKVTTPKKLVGPVTSAHVDWTKFGVQKPIDTSEGVKAKIKTGNDE